MAKTLFVDLEEDDQYSLKFILFGHIGEDISQCVAIDALHVSPIQHFKNVVTKVIKISPVGCVSSLENAIMLKNTSVKSEDKRKTTRVVMRKAKLVRDGAVNNLSDTATSTLSLLPPIDKDGRDMLAFQALRTIQDSIPDSSILLLSCVVAITLICSGFIYVDVFETLNSFDKENDRITLLDNISEVLRRVHARHSSSFSKAKCFSATLAEGR